MSKIQSSHEYPKLRIKAGKQCDYRSLFNLAKQNCIDVKETQKYVSYDVF